MKKCHLSRSLSWGLKDEEDVGKGGRLQAGVEHVHKGRSLRGRQRPGDGEPH